MTRLRVLTWNVQHAAALRTHQQTGWLATTEPHDILVLTEVAASETGRLLAQLLGEFGYTVHVPDAGLDRYRVLLACRTGVLDMVSETGVEFLPHRCLAARIKLPETVVGVVGLYVPSRGPKEQRNVAKRGFQDAVTAALPGLIARLNVSGRWWSPETSMSSSPTTTRATRCSARGNTTSTAPSPKLDSPTLSVSPTPLAWITRGSAARPAMVNATATGSTTFSSPPRMLGPSVTAATCMPSARAVSATTRR